MDVKDLKANAGNIDLVLDIIEKGEVREFNKFGKPGRVCSCKCKDETGQVELSLGQSRDYRAPHQFVDG